MDSSTYRSGDSYRRESTIVQLWYPDSKWTPGGKTLAITIDYPINVGDIILDFNREFGGPAWKVIKVWHAIIVDGHGIRQSKVTYGLEEVKT